MMDMTQKDFYRETIAIIAKQAIEPNPEYMAHAIYFHMKQYPENVKVGKAFEIMVRNTKNLLLEHFKWDMDNLFDFMVKFHDLTKYIKKTT